jgi:ATP-dependent Clp endopeptidase proteolytic subunit ClpP
MGNLTFEDLDAEVAAKRLRDMGARHKSAKDGDQPAGPWYAFKNLADGDTTAQIDIYDEIDWYWGVSAIDFRNELKALPDSVSQIDLHINSPGGDVYEAIAIMNCLRQYDATVVTTVDGLAASSAGFIAVGASDELIIAENAEIMAHLPWAITIGDAADMRKMADDLDRISKNIASIFVGRAGGTLDEWMAILTDETWWSAEEAVSAGIADSVLKAPKRDAKAAAKNRFNLSVFNHAGRSDAPAPRIPQAHNQTPPTVEAEKEKEPNMGTLSESALQKLGLDADADEAAIDAALDAALAEKAPEGDTAPMEPTPDQVAAVAAKYGLTVLDKGAHDQLLAQARDGAEARAQQVRDQDDATIRDALNSGRITPASVDTWRKSLAENRDNTAALIATLPENKALAVDELGHGIDKEDAAFDADKAYAFAQITGHTYGKDA